MLIMCTLFSSISPGALDGFLGMWKDARKESNIVDHIYHARKNKNVVDNFSGISRAHAALDASYNQYHVDIGPIAGSASSGYVYATFFNPSGSGRTAVIKRIAVRANAVTTANYVNLTVRRTTTASAGTQIASNNIPRKNDNAATSTTEIRYANVTASLAGTTDSRILGQSMPGVAGQFHSVRDVTFAAGDEKLVLQTGEGIAIYQEAAGDVDQRITVYIEWEEVTSGPSSGDSYLFAFPRVENAASANYVYNAFFNPGASGKSALVRRIWYGSETCDGAAVYSNNIVLRRITASSAGTQVTASNVPKKNTSSSNSAMEFRHTGVTVTATGTADSRLGHVTPCGAAGQATGWQKIDFDENDEQLTLKAGEGIALMSDAAGNANQIVRMIIEWKEVATASTPSAAGEFMWASNKVASTTQANASLYTVFNPAASGKTLVVKRLALIVNATTTATYPSYNIRRVSAASGGTMITKVDIQKKNTGSNDSITEIRWCLQACPTGLTATYVGAAESRILSVTGPGTVGQIIGQRELAFGANERLVLKEGEGIGVYPDGTTSSVAHTVKIYVEWDEEASAPSAQTEYIMDIGPIAGNTGTSYNYATFFNPAGAATTTVIKRLGVRVDTVNTAVYIPIQVRRITAASAGTQISASNFPKKNTSTVLSSMEIRTTGVTATYVGTSTESQLIGLQTPGAVASAVLPNNSAYAEYIFTNDEPIVLQAGEGIVIYHDTAAGDADFRVRLSVEWAEVTNGSAPAAQNEYMVTSNWVTGSSTTGFIYASFFNPLNSGKNYTVKRLGIKANRVGTLVAPGNMAITVRRTTTASGGRMNLLVNIPKKHSSSATSTAEVTYAQYWSSLVANLSTVADSRVMTLIAPGAVNQNGTFESDIVDGDEMILLPGEGIVLYQESNAGDLLMRYRLFIAWAETAADPPHFTLSAFRFFNNSLGSLDVGSALASLNTAASLTATNALFRLRTLVHVATSTLAQGGQNFTWQYAGKGGGTCASPSGTPSTYTAITNTTPIAYASSSNAVGRDGFQFTYNTSDPTHSTDATSTQSFNIWNTFSNAFSRILSGTDGKWDVAFVDNNASPGTVYCLRPAKTATVLTAWGWNDLGQIGIGGNGTTTSTVRIATSTITVGNWKMVKGSRDASFGLRSDGTIWAWGGNLWGELGQGYSSSTFAMNSPVQIGTSTNWAFIGIVPSGFSAAAIDTSGRLYTWGQNPLGQTGQSTTTYPTLVPSPVQLGSVTTWKEAEISNNSGIGIRTDGTLWSWGADPWGELGLALASNATSTPTTTVNQIGSDTKWVSAHEGNNFVIALKSDGTIWSWGRNLQGELGIGLPVASNPYKNSPQQIGTDTDWVEVGAGSNWAGARKSDGTIWTWGNNSFGQMGQGSTTYDTILSPLKVGTDTDWISFKPTGGFALALKSNGAVYAWASNNLGQQESNAALNTSVLTPTRIGTASNWTYIAGGFRHALVLGSATTSLDVYDYYPQITTYTAAAEQTLSFSLSDNTINFGPLSSSATRYASSTGPGDSLDVVAHTFAVATNAASGYTVTVRGATLALSGYPATTISAIGGSNTAPAIGTEQFGIRASVSGSNGTVTAPYAASGFAYAADATTASQIASAASGDEATGTYSVRYMANVSPTTDAGNYSANIVYVVTANY